MSSIELQDLRKLFEEVERESNPERKLAFLEEALDETDDLAVDHPGSEELAVALNLRRSHLHRLLTQLASMRRDFDRASWVHYVKLLFLRVYPEVEAILADAPDLDKAFREFVAMWGNELIAELEQLRSGH